MTNLTDEAVIGLEVHLQVRTASKAFCGCPTSFGAPPNSQTCPVCLGLPGVLPVLNQGLVEAALRLGSALGARIAPVSWFDRKNFFYPDLPKGYQITQRDAPVCTGGELEIPASGGQRKRIPLERIHMEEDAARTLVTSSGDTLIDHNRAGIPLLEIVTTPAVASPAEAAAVFEAVRQLGLYLGISDGKMEEGNLRCDANVSVRGSRSEIKNLNSFRHVERALSYEIGRLAGLDQGTPSSVTVQWDAAAGRTTPMRDKESSSDYRYLREPDLPPVITDAAWVERIAGSMPELPAAKRRRFVDEWGLPERDALVLTAEPATALYCEAVVGRLGLASALLAANWVRTEVLALASRSGLPPGELSVGPEALADLLALVRDGSVSARAAKEVFATMAKTGEPASVIVDRAGLTQLSDDSALAAAVDAVLAAHPAETARWRTGATNLLGFFVGEVMKETRGRANPARVHALLNSRLEHD
jgi:aspartyl-tRNA(Asn)/glutamyl-tRNA(Gln) amidotransferase subunit B